MKTQLTRTATATLLALAALTASLALTSTAQAQSHPHMAPAADDHIYKAFGEREGLTALMTDFVDRLQADARTGPFFKKANKPRLIEQLTNQLCLVSGGPCQYTGADMKTAHESMDIHKGDFNALVEVLQQSMDAKGIPFAAQNGMLARLAPMHRDIITAP